MRLWRKGARRKGAGIVRSLPPVTSEQAWLIFRLGKLYEPGLLSPEAKLKITLCVAVYLVGCLLLYCGVLNTVGHLYTHHELRFLPDTDLPNSFAKAANSVLDGAAILPNSFAKGANLILDGAAILILRPFVAAWMVGVALAFMLFTLLCIFYSVRGWSR